MIDTAKPYYYLTDMVGDRLQDHKSLSRMGVKIYGNHFYLPHPFGYKNPAVYFNVEKRLFSLETSLPKLLQGHNVFGTNDLQYLCLEAARLIYRRLGLPFTSRECQLIEDHRIRLGRLDTTCSHIMPARSAVAVALEEAWLQFRADGKHWSMDGIDGVETLYNQKHSQRVTDKFYDKFAELLVRRIPHCVPLREQIMKLAELLLRYEVTWRGKELKRLDLDHADQWNRERVISVMSKRLEHLDFRGAIKVRLLESELDTLTMDMSKRDAVVYSLWQRGSDLRVGRHYPPIRKARESLRQHGVDIFRPYGSASEFSLKEMLTAEKARFGIPRGY
jgi:hypothetical protein